MNFHITNIEPKYDMSGHVKVVRFGLSFFEDGEDPHTLTMGYLLNHTGGVNPPRTYSQHGSPTNVIMHSEEFLESLAKLWRTHPELKPFADLVAPEVSRNDTDRLPLKERVTISLKGIRDGV